MEIENTDLEVSNRNPLQGIANFLSAATNSRYSRNGGNMEAAPRVQTVYQKHGDAIALNEYNKRA